MEKLFEVNCAGHSLKVYDDCVSISPKGVLGFATKGMAGERKIFYKDITSIQFKPSSKLLSGFIEFYFAGHNTQKQGGGLFAGTTNDNRFTFHNKFLSQMEEIHDFIQNKINPSSTGNKTNNSIEELKGLKELLDAGIITQSEFDAKKRQILNL